ncbi:MAG: 30S ribosomal protein S16 [Candidatus Saccharimonadales bacterium]
MLAIRLQRLGRKGYPMYRIAVQESQRHPSSGRVVAYVGSYNPHTKETTINLEKISFYLDHGAQPTPRVAKILNEQKVKLPSWVKGHTGSKAVSIKNQEKLRKNRPVEEVEEAVEEPVTEDASTEADKTE